MNDKPNHIYLVIDSRHYGGIEAHVCALARKLMEQVIPVTILLWSDYPNNNVIMRIKMQRLPFQVLQGKPWQKLRQLHRLAQTSIIHSHGYKAGLMCRAASLLAPQRSVHTLHSGESGDGLVRGYLLADMWSAVLSNTMAVSEAIQQRLPYSSQLIKNFVSLPNHPVTIGSGQRRLGFVGRYCHDKGFDQFVALSQQLPQYQWHSFGSGEQQPLTINSNVTDHGFVDDCITALKQIDLLVMPSRYEGLPLAALEAMAAGVPVVAFNVGDLSKLIDDQVGKLVHANEMIAMTTAIEQIASLNDAELRQLGNRARQRIRHQWQGEDTLKQCLQCYRQLGWQG